MFQAPQQRQRQQQPGFWESILPGLVQSGTSGLGSLLGSMVMPGVGTVGGGLLGAAAGKGINAGVQAVEGQGQSGYPYSPAPTLGGQMQQDPYAYMRNRALQSMQAQQPRFVQSGYDVIDMQSMMPADVPATYRQQEFTLAPQQPQAQAQPMPQQDPYEAMREQAVELMRQRMQQYQLSQQPGPTGPPIGDLFYWGGGA